MSLEKFAKVINLYALVQMRLCGQLVFFRVVAITPVDGAGGLIAYENRSVAQDNPVGFGGCLYLTIPVGAVVGLENLLRGLHEEMMVAVVKVNDNRRSKTLRFSQPPACSDWLHQLEPNP